jgi:hypothetical protein
LSAYALWATLIPLSMRFSTFFRHASSITVILEGSRCLDSGFGPWTADEVVGKPQSFRSRNLRLIRATAFTGYLTPGAFIFDLGPMTKEDLV